MNRYSFVSEKQALREELTVLIRERGNDLLDYYLNNGFDSLAVGLKLFTDWQRRMLFDYLMLDRKALLECVRRNKAFFLKMITDGKGDMIRPMLGVDKERYDGLWLEVIDLLALYFAEKKVVEKMTNFELEKFMEQSIFKVEQKEKKSDATEQNQ